MSPFHFSFYLNNQGAPHFCLFFIHANLSPFKSWLLFGRCCQRPYYYIQSTCRMSVVTDYSSQIHGFFPKYTKFSFLACFVLFKLSARVRVNRSAAPLLYFIHIYSCFFSFKGIAGYNGNQLNSLRLALFFSPDTNKTLQKALLAYRPGALESTAC
jgi:hypothetical protein